MTAREDYEQALRLRQKMHLARVQERRDIGWRPCAHDACPECVGTGVKLDGSTCVHGTSCSCSKCSPVSFMGVPLKLDPSLSPGQFAYDAPDGFLRRGSRGDSHGF